MRAFDKYLKAVNYCAYCKIIWMVMSSSQSISELNSIFSSFIEHPEEFYPLLMDGVISTSSSSFYTSDEKIQEFITKIFTDRVPDVTSEYKDFLTTLKKYFRNTTKKLDQTPIQKPDILQLIDWECQRKPRSERKVGFHSQTEHQICSYEEKAFYTYSKDVLLEKPTPSGVFSLIIPDWKAQTDTQNISFLSDHLQMCLEYHATIKHLNIIPNLVQGYESVLRMIIGDSELARAIHKVPEGNGIKVSEVDKAEVLFKNLTTLKGTIISSIIDEAAKDSNQEIAISSTTMKDLVAKVKTPNAVDLVALVSWDELELITEEYNRTSWEGEKLFKVSKFGEYERAAAEIVLTGYFLPANQIVDERLGEFFKVTSTWTLRLISQNCANLYVKDKFLLGLIVPWLMSRPDYARSAFE